MRPQLDVEVCLRTRSTGISRTEFDRLHRRGLLGWSNVAFSVNLIALENRLSRDYGDAQVESRGLEGMSVYD